MNTEKTKITYLKEAEEAGMNVWDFAEFIRKKKVVWVKEVGIVIKGKKAGKIY